MFYQIVLWTFAFVGVRFGYRNIVQRNNPIIRRRNTDYRKNNAISSPSSIQDFKLSSSKASATIADRFSNKLSCRGDTQSINSNHPVITLVMERWQSGSKPLRRESHDKAKIALSIEGGGMRGCVSAGASAALHFLGLNDCIDVVYGSSAGAMVGAYFVSRQLSGVQIYHDILPSAGTRFINKLKLLTAMGAPKWSLSGVLKIQTNSYKSQQSKSLSSSDDVFNLDYLLNQVMKGTQKLDWTAFDTNEKYQPLRIIACCARSLKTVPLCRENGNYIDLVSLLSCIRASMSVPGITGPMMAIHSLHEDMSSSSNAVTYEDDHNHGNNRHSNNQENLRTSTGTKAVVKGVVQLLRIPFPITHWHHNHHRHIEDCRTSTTIHTRNNHRHMKNALNISVHNSSSLNKVTRFVKRVSGRYLVKLNYIWRNRNTQIEVIESVGDNSKSSNNIYDKSGTKTDNKLINPLLNLYPFAVSTKSITTAMATVSQSKTSIFPNMPSAPSSLSSSFILSGLVDACISEPIPYRSAVDEGATHIIVLRTKPDPCVLNFKGPGVFERFIAKRFFRHYKQHDAMNWVMQMEHQKIYCEDIRILNEGAKGHTNGISVQNKQVHILPIAPSSLTEVSQLETERSVVFQGMRDGAKRVFEIFGPSMNLPAEVTVDELVDMVFPPTLLDKELLTDLETDDDVLSFDFTTFGINIHN